MGEGLRVGESDNTQTCPMCGGGPNNDKSFRLMRYDDGIGFRCYRNKCGFSGGSNSSPPRDRSTKVVKPSKPFRRRLEMLSAAQVDDITALYPALRATTVERWCYSPEMRRVVIPTKNRYGGRWGYEAKRLRLPWCDDGGQKSILYYDSPVVPRIAYARLYPESDTLIITEDTISAHCIGSAGFSGAAILGTSLDYKRIDELAHTCNHLIIALDPDAHKAALKLADACRLLFQSVRVVFFDKDPKDSTLAEITDVLGGIYGTQTA